jgi:hypothetical protein
LLLAVLSVQIFDDYNKVFNICWSILRQFEDMVLGQHGQKGRITGNGVELRIAGPEEACDFVRALLKVDWRTNESQLRSPDETKDGKIDESMRGIPTAHPLFDGYMLEYGRQVCEVSDGDTKSTAVIPMTAVTVGVGSEDAVADEAEAEAEEAQVCCQIDLQN